MEDPDGVRPYSSNWHYNLVELPDDCELPIRWGR
jgi:nitrogen fixation protein